MCCLVLLGPLLKRCVILPCFAATEFKEVVPSWVYTVKIPADYAEDKLVGCSDGMQMVGTNTVQRKRTGHFDTDAAKWGRGFTSG